MKKNKKHPKKIVSSFKIAKSLQFKKLKKSIIKSIANSSFYSYCYAKELKFQNVPRSIIESVAKNINHSYYYAENLNYKNVPKDILHNIKEEKEILAWKLYKLHEKNKKVPKCLIRALSTNIEYSYVYASYLDFVNVENIIIKKIIKDNFFLKHYLLNIDEKKHLFYYLAKLDKRIILK